MNTRANRFQSAACHSAITNVLGHTAADMILNAAGVANLPESLPTGPRDLAALTAELDPFVALYRVLLQHCERECALAIMRAAIIDSGRTSHGASQQAQASHDLLPDQPLVLTSPPPHDFQASPEDLQSGFDLAMQFFSCEGQLLSYTPDLVRFTITDCNWCRAMQASGAPELIAFFCETDERFMDGHPTHQLIRPIAIGVGDDHCDFQFVRRSTYDTH
jgi:hypothetical protein